MTFSPVRFVRHMPASALQDYVHRRAPELHTVVDWRDDEITVRASFVQAVEQLPAEIREQIYLDLERAEQLTGEVGERAIAAASPDLGTTIALFEEMDGDHERCLWLLTNVEATFRRAEEIRFSEYHRRSPRMWEGYFGPPEVQIIRTDEAKRSFADELTKYFRKHDGSGRTIEVEIFDRSPRAEEDDDGDLIQVTVYLEAMPATVMEFGKRGLDTRVQRPAIEVAITYAPRSGVIEIIARGGHPVRQQVAKVFLANLLAANGDDLALMPLRRYDLTSLHRLRSFPTDPEDGIRTVKVTRLRLRPLGSKGGRSVTVEVDRRSEGSLYDAVRSWFGPSSPLAGRGFHIDRARIAIEFHPQSGARRGKVLHVEITLPHRCNLRDRTRHEQLIGDKYLAHWGLVPAGESDGQAVA